MSTNNSYLQFPKSIKATQIVHHQSYATDQTHMRILMSGKNLVQFAWKVHWRLLARRKFTQGKVGVVAIGMIDATRWYSIWWCQRALGRWMSMVIAQVALHRLLGR